MGGEEVVGEGTVFTVAVVDVAVASCVGRALALALADRLLVADRSGPELVGAAPVEGTGGANVSVVAVAMAVTAVVDRSGALSVAAAPEGLAGGTTSSGRAAKYASALARRRHTAAITAIFRVPLSGRAADEGASSGAS